MLGEKVVPIQHGIETAARREPLRQVLDYMVLPSIVGWRMTHWLGGKALGMARKSAESTLLVLDSQRLGRHREANNLPAKVQTIEKDIKDINKGEHEDKPALIAINAVSWYRAVREYHEDLLQSGEARSQDYVNQLVSMMDEAGVSDGELVSALSDTWVEDPIGKELLEHMQPTSPGPTLTSS